jgi:hypothetical protein
VESEATIVIRLWSEKIVVFWIILSRTSASSRFITHNGTAIVMLSQIGTEEDHVLSDHTLVDNVFAMDVIAHVACRRCRSSQASYQTSLPCLCKEIHL